MQKLNTIMESSASSDFTGTIIIRKHLEKVFFFPRCLVLFPRFEFMFFWCLAMAWRSNSMKIYIRTLSSLLLTSTVRAIYTDSRNTGILPFSVIIIMIIIIIIVISAIYI